MFIWLAASALLSFAVTYLLGRLILPQLQRFHLGQTVRAEGPKRHYKKNGTPTMGGIFFVLPILLFLLLLSFRTGQSESWALLLLFAFMAALGFLDDYVKVRRDKRGLSVLQKTLPMLLILLLFAVYTVYFSPLGAEIRLPFTDWTLLPHGIWKPLYALFLTVFLYFTINAVNLTDGEDGLLAGVGLPLFLGMTLILSLRPAYLNHGFAIPTAAALGGLAAFLIFNHYPAKVFMGDHGSLALGALYAGLLALCGLPWLLLLNGFIFLMEALSVVIQVAYFKATGGKRIFRMSPIHHHFELGGWSENRILAVFSSVTGLLSLVAVLALV